MALWGAAWLFTAGCVPEFVEGASLIDEPRVLAVRSEPAQAEPGSEVALSALVAGPADAADEGRNLHVSYYFCLARKALSELGPVSPECLGVESSDSVDALGSGQELPAVLPEKGCSLFGPDRPEPEPGQPAGRPVDADSTGGYYQPVLAQLSDQQHVVLGAVRLECGLTGVGRELVTEYNKRNEPNENPELRRLERRVSGSWQSLSAAQPPAVSRGEKLTLRAVWSDAETYLRFDPQSRQLVETDERVVVTWYSTGGEFEQPRSAAASGTRSAPNTWLAPSERGPVGLWAVIRDGRGGIAWTSLELDVR
jgi:hypothetical protein